MPMSDAEKIRALREVFDTRHETFEGGIRVNHSTHALENMAVFGGIVTRRGALDMQVCVPKGWTDEQVKKMADKDNPCGTEHGWYIRREGDPALAGAAERVQCSGNPNAVHIMLDA